FPDDPFKQNTWVKYLDTKINKKTGQEFMAYIKGCDARYDIMTDEGYTPYISSLIPKYYMSIFLDNGESFKKHMQYLYSRKEKFIELYIKDSAKYNLHFRIPIASYLTKR